MAIFASIELTAQERRGRNVWLAATLFMFVPMLGEHLGGDLGNWDTRKSILYDILGIYFFNREIRPPARWTRVVVLLPFLVAGSVLLYDAACFVGGVPIPNGPCTALISWETLSLILGSAFAYWAYFFSPSVRAYQERNRPESTVDRIKRHKEEIKAIRHATGQIQTS